MRPTSQEFHELVCKGHSRKFADFLQDGFSGMFVVLKYIKETEGEISAGDISQKFCVSTARTAVILSNLQKKGYITKTKSSADARKTLVQLTEQGKEAILKREEKIISMIDELLDKLTDQEAESLYNIIKKIIAHWNASKRHKKSINFVQKQRIHTKIIK